MFPSWLSQDGSDVGVVPQDQMALTEGSPGSPNKRRMLRASGKPQSHGSEDIPGDHILGDPPNVLLVI